MSTHIKPVCPKYLAVTRLWHSLTRSNLVVMDKRTVVRGGQFLFAPSHSSFSLRAEMTRKKIQTFSYMPLSRAYIFFYARQTVLVNVGSPTGYIYQRVCSLALFPTVSVIFLPARVSPKKFIPIFTLCFSCISLYT